MNEEIFQYLTGNTDDSSAIGFNIETGNRSIAAYFEQIVQPVEIELEVKKGHNIEVYISIDNENFKPVGKAQRGINRITLATNVQTDDFLRCQVIKLALRETSKAECVIGRCAILYYELSDVEELRD